MLRIPKFYFQLFEIRRRAKQDAAMASDDTKVVTPSTVPASSSASAVNPDVSVKSFAPTTVTANESVVPASGAVNRNDVPLTVNG